MFKVISGVNLLTVKLAEAFESARSPLPLTKIVIVYLPASKPEITSVPAVVLSIVAVTVLPSLVNVILLTVPATTA